MIDHKLADPQVEEPLLENLSEDELAHEDDTIIGVAFKWSLLVIFIIVLVVAGSLYFSRDRVEEEQATQPPDVDPPDPIEAVDKIPSVAFTDITSEAGITFAHFNGATGEKLLPETMGGGVAFFDYDNDGDADLLFVNGMPWPDDDDPEPMPTTQLFQNDGNGRFTDVTKGSGLDVTMYGMGPACGDIDNDGDVDVFLTGVGPNRMFRNDGGRFTEITDTSNTSGDPNAWSSGSGFFDYDNDGLLDLFVCNYIQWSKTIDLQLNFTLNGVDRAYGPPKSYKGAQSYLYHNEGNGDFREVGEDAGIHVHNPATGEAVGKALAVRFADFERDGDLDVFVANDTVENFAFMNNGDGTFTHVGTSGVEFDNSGMAQGSMGSDIEDIENNGRLALAIGNFATEPTALYVQQSPWAWTDMASGEGVAGPSRIKLSFGLFFFDYDLDNRLDLLQANGHLEEEINETQPSQFYHQSAQLFWNAGPDGKCFAYVPEHTTGALATEIVGRGAAYADIDDDGDQDVVITQIGARPLLLRNDQALGHHSVRLKLVGTSSNRDAIGAIVELTSDGVTQTRMVAPTRSYLSQVELPLTFGLGTAHTVDSVRIVWPSGVEQSLNTVAIDELTVIEEPNP